MPGTPTRALRAALVAAAAVIAAGCGPEPPSRVAVVLIDRSQSADETREGKYRDSVATLLPYFDRRGGTIDLGIIDNKSHLHELDSAMVPHYSSSQYSPLTYRPALVRGYADVCDNLDEVFAHTADDQGTTILDAMDVAEDAFADNENNQERYLVILSDMIEESSRLPPLRPGATDKEIGDLIAEERDGGRIPDLEGVDVYVGGAGGTDPLDQPPESTRTWRRFWELWFGEAGAKVQAYGLRLQSFPKGIAQKPLACELVYVHLLQDDVKSGDLSNPLDDVESLILARRSQSACGALEAFDDAVDARLERGRLNDDEAEDLHSRTSVIRRLLRCA